MGQIFPLIDFRPLLPPLPRPASAPMELGNFNVATEAEDEETAAADASYFDAEYERYLTNVEKYEVESTTDETEEEGTPAVQLQAMQPPHSSNSNPNRVPYLTREEFTRCMKQGLCLRCKKPGHVARNCDLPPRQSYPHRPQSHQLQSRLNYQNSRRGISQPRRNFD